MGGLHLGPAMGGVLTTLACSVILVGCAVPQPGATGRTLVVDNRAANAADDNRGTVAEPLRTIQAGADRAQPGDTVLVKAGIYRETVVPPRGGTASDRAITYLAAPGEPVSIRGSERITTWVDRGAGIWCVELETAFFKGYNPFARPVAGKWLHRVGGYRLGDVYCDGEALRQTLKPADLRSTPNTWYVDPRFGYRNKSDFPADRRYPNGMVTIQANFGDVDPNRRLTEINARAACFFPAKAGLKFLVIDGFDIRHAAPQWADIYTLEKGAIGTRYGYGWTIRNCTITNSRNIGISMGVTDEVPFPEVLNEGGGNIPPMETLGHHVIRNNVIRRCGQAGIYGCYGAAGSVLEGNVITETNYRSEWFGSNQAAIKILFPIDVVIRNNVLTGVPGVRTNAKGIWLDWGAQNARVTGNLLCDFGRSRGLFLEVNFGPIVVDGNILVRCEVAVESNGVVFANNLFHDCSFRFWSNPGRTTPYYRPHSTIRAGKASVTLDHIRVWNNIVSGGGGFGAAQVVREGADPAGIESDHNAFLNGARGFPREGRGSIALPGAAAVSLEQHEGAWTLRMDLPEALLLGKHAPVTSKRVGRIPLAAMGAEHPDGAPLDITADYFGRRIDPGSVRPGPIQAIRKGANTFVVWPR
ncbi:MAG: hypothetical protein CMJ83_22005 [Planctomycetes bacterium]|nr:hypothetical protein [Planctomycetota bacterium]